jgi:hypothetical protein
MMTSTATLTMATVIDLAAIANPYNGFTSGNADQISLCGSGPEQGFSYALAPGRRIVIGQTSNDFDSMHTLRYGGAYPGEVLVSCIDDPDEEKIEFSNNDVNAVTVYFIIDGYDSGSFGVFTLEWEVPCPAGSVHSSLPPSFMSPPLLPFVSFPPILRIELLFFSLFVFVTFPLVVFSFHFPEDSLALPSFHRKTSILN